MDWDDWEVKYIMTLTVVIIIIAAVFVLIMNYAEYRQCDILSEGSSTRVEYFFGFVAKCYIKMDSGKIIDADNYRGMVE